jgi:hypothetical protein
MVAAQPAGQAVFVHGLNEELEHSFSTVVVAGPDAGDKPRFPVCKGVCDDLEAYKALV